MRKTYPMPVVFEVPTGELIRFSATVNGVLEEVDCGNGFEAKGVASEILYIPSGDDHGNKIVDDKGRGGCLPADVVQREAILTQISELCESVNIRHNITVARIPDVIFEAPSGDVIKFSAGDGYVEESTQNADGSWTLRGSATEFTYTTATRKIVDQDGRGGVLPVEGHHDLQHAIKRLCDASHVPHNMLQPHHPQHRHLRMRGRSSSGGNSSEGSLISNHSFPSSVGSRSGGVRRRALLVGLCETRDAAVSRSIKRLYKLISESNPHGAVSIQTLETQPGQILKREDLLRGLEWLVENVQPEGSVFLGIVGSAVTQAQGCAEDGLELAGDDSFTNADFASYLSTLPASVHLTVINDVSPTAEVFSLPHKAASNEGGGVTHTDTGSQLYDGCRAKVVMLSPAAASMAPQSTQIGLFSDMCVKVLSRNAEMGCEDLLSSVKVALGNVRAASSTSFGALTRHFRNSTKPLVLPMISSNMPFDLRNEVFSVCESSLQQAGLSEALPHPSSRGLRRRNLVLLGGGLPPTSRSRYSASVAGSNASGSTLAGLKATPSGPQYTNEQVKQALVQIYTKHNPSRMTSIDKFVHNYRGQYKNMFEMIYAKYQDPEILDMYDPAWE